MRRLIIGLISVCSMEMKDVFSRAYHKVWRQGETAWWLQDNNFKPFSTIFICWAATSNFFSLSLNMTLHMFLSIKSQRNRFL